MHIKPDFDEWKTNHDCQFNHIGSSGSMESLGAIEIFGSSIDKHKLRYTKYLGDGDTSSFTEVSDSKPYSDDVDISKLQFIGRKSEPVRNVGNSGKH